MKLLFSAIQMCQSTYLVTYRVHQIKIIECVDEN